MWGANAQRIAPQHLCSIECAAAVAMQALTPAQLAARRARARRNWHHLVWSFWRWVLRVHLDVLMTYRTTLVEEIPIAAAMLDLNESDSDDGDAV